MAPTKRLNEIQEQEKLRNFMEEVKEGQVPASFVSISRITKATLKIEVSFSCF